MSIKFEKERKIFHLSTKDYSYYIHVNKLNYLIHLYDGKLIDDISKERASERYMERYAYVSEGKEVVDESFYFSQIASLMECASFGKADKRGSFAIIEGEDGIDMTNFLYVSHEIKKQASFPYKFPHVRFEGNDAEELVILTKDEYREIYLELHYIISEKYDCMVRYSKVINKEKSDIIIKKLSSMELDIPSMDYNVVSLRGEWSDDTHVDEIPLNHAVIRVADNHGARGFFENPSVILKKKDATYDFGEVYAFSIIYSGDFAYEFRVDENENTRMTVGINEETFRKTLKTGEEFFTPEVLMSYSSEGINKVSQRFHDVVREKILPQKYALKERPILLNSWEAFFMDITTDKMIQFIDEAKKVDCELVVIDDGWFRVTKDDASSLGDWKVDEKIIDLKKLVDHAHEIGMKIGLWFEPEMISPNSDLYREHPEYALYPKKISNPTLFRHQLVLDLCNKEARDNVFKQVCEVLDKYPFDYVKWDFNRFLSEAYSEVLSKEHKLETSYLFTLGTYDLFERFNERYPDILLESCASGGGRFDLGMLYYSVQAWASDETDITQRANIQFAKNLFYPLSTQGAHVSSRLIGSIQDKACLAFFGTYGYELDILKSSEEDKAKMKEFNKLVKEWHHVVTLGDYYAIYDPFKTNYVAWNVVTKDKNECLAYFMNYRKEGTKSRYLKIRGLDPNKYYFNSITNDIYKGSFYMNLGVNISTRLEVFTSMLIVLKAVDPIRATLYRKMKQVDAGRTQKEVDEGGF